MESVKEKLLVDLHIFIVFEQLLYFSVHCGFQINAPTMRHLIQKLLFMLLFN